jgi:hypothetical protein
MVEMVAESFIVLPLSRRSARFGRMLSLLPARRHPESGAMMRGSPFGRRRSKRLD